MATAIQTSAYSLKAIAAGLLPLMEESGGSIVSLDFDGRFAWPVYDWMGVAKAGLEAVTRYLARDLGPKGIRVNTVSAGPLKTMAGKGIPGFEQIADVWARRAPLGWDIVGPDPVGRAIAFLFSDLSAGITGEMIHVDGGFHAMGTDSSRRPPTTGRSRYGTRSPSSVASPRCARAITPNASLSPRLVTGPSVAGSTKSSGGAPARTWSA